MLNAVESVVNRTGRRVRIQKENGGIVVVCEESEFTE